MRNCKSKFKILAFCAVVFPFALLISNFAVASTNINSGNPHHWAWNDVIGWLDFISANNVNVYADRLEGYALSQEGYIALNCNSTPNGDICGASNFKVSNDGNGNLSGWAWNDAIGWISFDSATAGSSYAYQVFVNTTTGIFSGWAWNDVVGWISFNCNNSGIGDTCGTSNYDVKTSWRAQTLSGSLISSVFDTGLAGGATLNNILWQGNNPSGADVRFQIASSDSSSGPWSYIGPDGSSASYYSPADANIPVQISQKYHNNQRYFRYKAFLESDPGQTASPRVDSIIINWSP
jgi:hypothetical protein